MQKGIITKSRSKLRNLLFGLTPTSDTFDTQPTSLTTCTNGVWTAATGAGSKVLGGAGDVGYVYFDLGTNKQVMVWGKIGLWTSAGAAYVFVDFKEDGASAYKAMSATTGSVLATTNTSEATGVFDLLPSAGYGRYIRIRTYVNGAATTNIKLYEIVANEVS